ncbi:MAG TPA: fluoride efflux transporter CrcB [Bacteroidia bacterium]|jgi:CrcB protein|nr:fluoride efflux transporter CrcB [Bacteroidia bacterium]
MLKAISIVGIGGAIGSIFRFLLTDAIEARFIPSHFPYGTLVVNVTGCFAIGLIYALTDKFNVAPEWRAFLATGICGGYTTFSAFSYQGISLMREGHTTQFFVYIFGSVLLGLIATLIPVVLIEKLT